MIAHPNPKTIALIGGGPGGALREILRHETVESVTMIEMDEMIVQIAREHLPTYNDCSDIVGLEGNCFDNDKATIIYEEATQWFKTRYGKDATQPSTQKFDVIILDTVDPKFDPPMYKDPAFVDALLDSLTDEGLFALDAGGSFSVHDPKPDVGVYAPRERFFNILEAHPSTGAMMVYEEAHAGYDDPRDFLTVCKNKSCRKRWYESPVAIDDEIYERIRRTHSAKAPLISFDGTTHYTYQTTPKGWEVVYCRREPQPWECQFRGLDLNTELFEYEDEELGIEGSFDLKTETVDGEEVTSIFAKVDIPKGSYIMPSEAAASMTLTNTVIKGLEENTQVKDTGDVTVIEDFLEFVEENGHASMLEGNEVNYVEVGATTFIRKSEDASEVNVGRWMPDHPSGKIPVFSPVYERRMNLMDVFIVATRDIKAGEEVVRPLELF